jgi:hypothetical protein
MAARAARLVLSMGTPSAPMSRSLPTVTFSDEDSDAVTSS